MRNFFKNSFFIAFATLTSVQAQAGKDITGKKDDGSFESSKILLGESASARENKVAGAALELGAVIGGIPGGGLRGFYNHDESLQLGLQYLSGKVDLASQIGDTAVSKINSASLAANILVLQARYFLGNSFNIFSSLGQRTIGYEFKVSSTFDPNSYIKVSGKSVSTIFGAGIGNQWAWDNGLFIGGDWLAYYFSLGSRNSYSTETNGLAGSDQQKLANDMRDLSETLGRVGHFQITGHLGWMF